MMLHVLNDTFLNKFSLRKVPPVLWVVLAMIVFFSVATGGIFIRPSNVLNIALQGSMLMILSLGATVVILTQGIDLSLGSAMTLSGVGTVLLVEAGIPGGWAMLLGIGIGMLCGATNGLLISIGKLPPFIATFGMQGIAGGLAVVLVHERAILVTNPPVFQIFGRGQLGFLPMPFVVACVVFGIMYTVLYHTPFGHYIIAIGGNEEGAGLSGVNTVFWKLMTYTVAGTLAGVSGVLMAARLTAADSVVGVGWEFDAVAVTILGGTSFELGKGGVKGTVLGVILISMLRNGLNVVGVNPAYQALILGLVIIGSIVVDVILEKRKDG